MTLHKLLHKGGGRKLEDNFQNNSRMLYSSNILKRNNLISNRKEDFLSLKNIFFILFIFYVYYKHKKPYPIHVSVLRIGVLISHIIFLLKNCIFFAKIKNLGLWNYNIIYSLKIITERPMPFEKTSSFHIILYFLIIFSHLLIQFIFK